MIPCNQIFFFQEWTESADTQAAWWAGSLQKVVQFVHCTIAGWGADGAEMQPELCSLSCSTISNQLFCPQRPIPRYHGALPRVLPFLLPRKVLCMPGTSEKTAPALWGFSQRAGLEGKLSFCWEIPCGLVASNCFRVFLKEETQYYTSSIMGME